MQPVCCELWVKCLTLECTLSPALMIMQVVFVLLSTRLLSWCAFGDLCRAGTSASCAKLVRVTYAVSFKKFA